jgi:hypothetical protein
VITAPFPSTAFRTRVPTRSVPRSSRAAARLTPAGSPAPPRSCPRIVPAHSRDDHTIRRNLCVPARRKPKTEKRGWLSGTPRALLSRDSSIVPFCGKLSKISTFFSRKTYDQTVSSRCRFFRPAGNFDSAAYSTVDACGRGATREPAFLERPRSRRSPLARNANSRCPARGGHTRARGTRGPRGLSVGEARRDARLVVGG